MAGIKSSNPHLTGGELAKENISSLELMFPAVNNVCLTHALPWMTGEQDDDQRIHSPESRHFQWLPRDIVEPCFQSQSGTVT